MSKGKGESAERAVLDYLRRQNRPYSAVDVFNNLHKEYGKTVVAKSLECLAEKDEVREKAYGKQKIYYVNQERMGSGGERPTEEMDREAVRLGSLLKELRGRVREAESRLAALNGAPTDQQLRDRLVQTEDDNRQTAQRLGELKTDRRGPPPGNRDEIQKENREALREWKRRKRMACDVLEAVLEGYPKSKAALLLETGVETDEEAGVSFPPSSSPPRRR